MEIYERKSISMSCCTSVTRGEDRGGECSPPLILYVEKRECKEGCPEGGWKGISIYDGIDLPVSLFRRNNQGIM